MVERGPEQGKGWRVALALLVFFVIVEPGGANRAPRYVMLGRDLFLSIKHFIERKMFKHDIFWEYELFVGKDFLFIWL